MLVFFIKEKLRPCVDHAGFSHTWYDKAEVVYNGCLVCVKYASTSYLVVTPHGRKIGGKFIFIIVDNFSNEDYLSYCDILFHI